MRLQPCHRNTMTDLSHAARSMSSLDLRTWDEAINDPDGLQVSPTRERRGPPTTRSPNFASNFFVKSHPFLASEEATGERSPRYDAAGDRPPQLPMQSPTSAYSRSAPAAGPSAQVDRNNTGAGRRPPYDSYADQQERLPMESPTSPYRPHSPSAAAPPRRHHTGAGRSPQYDPDPDQAPWPPADSPTPSYSLFAPAAGAPLGRQDTGRSRSSQLPRDVRFTLGSRTYHGFSNYSLHEIHFEGKLYPTAEHLFQALKASISISKIQSAALN